MADERVEVESVAALRSWLEANHARESGLWLVTYRKHVVGRHVAWGEVVDELLCFGWIDSLPRKLDADRTMLFVSPRRAGSAWSRVNKQKVERLAEEGRIRPAGAARIEAAKADGSWSFLDDVEALVEPEDLAAALDRDPDARRSFDAFPPSARRGILEWIKRAKRPETRARRVAETARRAARNERAR